MAVKIDNVDALQETNSILKNYSNAIASATSDVDSKFQAKIDNQKAEALNQYIDIMNNLSSKVFVQFPNQIALFASALNSYHGSITGEGFTTKIRSSKPGVDEDYCKKLNDTQIDSIKDSSDEIKKIIDQIADDPDISGEISVGDSSTTITQAISTFETNLLEEIGNIKTTRSNLQEANTNLITKLSEITGKLNECEVAINRVACLTDPTSGLSPKKALELIVGGFFNKDNIDGLLNGVGEKGDIKAIEHLAKGDYESFFKLNPDKLSDGVFTVAAKQIADVTKIPSDKESSRKLQGILNALLEHGGNGHASKLSIANEVMARQNASLLLGLDPNNKDYERLTEDFKKYGTLSNLFTGLDALTDPKNTKIFHGGGPTVGQTKWFSINKLNIDSDGNMDFNLKTNTSFTDKFGNVSNVQEDAGSVDISKKGLAGSNMDDLAGQYQEKQKQQAVNDFLANSLATGVGIFSPGLGTGINIINEIAKGDYSGLKNKGVDSFASNFDNYGDYISGVNSLINDINSLGNNLNGLSQKEKDIVNNFRDTLIGVDKVGINQQGGQDIILDGIPSVQNIKALNELDTNGITNYLGNDSKQLETLYTELPPEGKLNDSQNYLLGQSNKSFTDLNPKELNDALNILRRIEPKGNYTADKLAEWLKNNK